jgi:hypothetical protein
MIELIAALAFAGLAGDPEQTAQPSDAAPSIQQVDATSAYSEPTPASAPTDATQPTNAETPTEPQTVTRCRLEAVIGSNIRQRVCRTISQEEAEREEAQRGIRRRIRNSRGAPTGAD